MISDDTRAPGLSRREIPNLQASATNWCDIMLSDSTPSISLTLILFLSISPCPFSVLHKRCPKGQNEDHAGQIDIVCVRMCVHACVRVYVLNMYLSVWTQVIFSVQRRDFLTPVMPERVAYTTCHLRKCVFWGGRGG